MLKVLGDASYAIYLVHFPVLSIGAKVMFGLGLEHALPRPIAFLALLTGAVATGLAFHFIAEKPLLRLLSRKDQARSITT